MIPLIRKHIKTAPEERYEFTIYHPKDAFVFSEQFCVYSIM